MHVGTFKYFNRETNVELRAIRDIQRMTWHCDSPVTYPPSAIVACNFCSFAKGQRDEDNGSFTRALSRSYVIFFCPLYLIPRCSCKFTRRKCRNVGWRGQRVLAAIVTRGSSICFNSGYVSPFQELATSWWHCRIQSLFRQLKQSFYCVSFSC